MCLSFSGAVLARRDDCVCFFFRVFLTLGRVDSPPLCLDSVTLMYTILS